MDSKSSEGCHQEVAVQLCELHILCSSQTKPMLMLCWKHRSGQLPDHNRLSNRTVASSRRTAQMHKVTRGCRANSHRVRRSHRFNKLRARRSNRRLSRHRAKRSSRRLSSRRLLRSSSWRSSSRRAGSSSCRVSRRRAKTRSHRLSNC